MPKKKSKEPVSEDAKAKTQEVINAHVLQAKLDHFENKCRELETEVQTLRRAVRTQMLDENDVLEHVRRESATKDEIVNTLQDKIHELLLEVQDKTHQHELTTEKANRAHRQSLAALDEENQRLKTELGQLQDFKRDKPRMEEEIKTLRAECISQRESAKAQLADVVRTYDVKEATVRRELQAKQAESEAHLEERALQRVDAITARTVVENQVKTEEIEFLHSEISVLRREMSKLSKENKSLKNQRAVAEEWRNQLLQRGSVLQSKVDLQAKRIEELEQLNEQLQLERRGGINARVSHLNQLLEDTRDKLRVSEKQLQRLQHQSQRMQPTEPLRWDKPLPSRAQMMQQLFPKGSESLLVHVMDEAGTFTEKAVPYTARGRLETGPVDLTVARSDRLPRVTNKELDEAGGEEVTNEKPYEPTPPLQLVHHNTPPRRNKTSHR